MKKNMNFSFFTLSVFDNCDYEQFVTIVNQIKKTGIERKIIEVENTGPCVDEFFKPLRGGSHFPKFCFWENHLYPHKVFFISNYEDGLYTLCNAIHRQIRGNLIVCSLSNETHVENPSYQFHYSDSNFIERHVLSYKEDKWVFYEEGSPLKIENLDNYKNRMIKKRLNNCIIEDYLLKLGIDIWNVFSSIDRSCTYSQIAW